MARNRKTIMRKKPAYLMSQILDNPSEISVNALKRKGRTVARVKRTNRQRGPFINFFRDYRRKHNKEPIVKMAANVSKLWNNMSAKLKQKYMGKKQKYMGMKPKRRGNNKSNDSKKRRINTNVDSLTSISQTDSHESICISDTSSLTGTTMSRSRSSSRNRTRE